jgi:hypothetical protein
VSGRPEKKKKLAGNARREKIEEGGNPDIRNWQCRGLQYIAYKGDYGTQH